MFQIIDISDEEIQYAERLLLPIGKTFDNEHKAFIRNFNTIDLQAVPGSGKTTALLAKLLILEKKLPFSDGSGVLVLSHTNAAIDEIKEKIQKHCPKLFSYPNFIGTIQSFVDKFLAIPFYNLKFKKKLIRIDNEIYNEKIKEYLDKLWFYKFDLNRETNIKIASLKHSNESLFYELRFQYNINKVQLVKKLNGDFLEIKKPRGNTKPQNYCDYTQQEKEDIYKWFFRFKKTILKLGVLHFDDAYFLADVYMSTIPNVKAILQKRFSYVFVDEMQDMDIHQYNLLEKIFYDTGRSLSKLQRIGDNNQSIYNSIKAEDVWINRDEVLRLTGSHRLSKPIADVVKKFALHGDDNFEIIGKNTSRIKPHILVFDNTTKENIIPCFAQIIKENGLDNSERPIKAICWNTEWSNDNDRQNTTKLRLEDYHQDFKKEKNKPRTDYNYLINYLLYYDKRKKTLKHVRDNILRSFLKILRLENINTIDGRPYTTKQLIDFIREVELEKYEELNLNLYNWSIGIIQGKIVDVWNNIRKYLPFLLEMFDGQISVSSNFINTINPEVMVENTEITENINCYKENGLEIEITSVHSVKGQTHCATLYLESCYQGKHESERLSFQFLGNAFNDKRKYHKSSTKMAYVGFSRPTDLLCVAIHKDRFNALLSEINKEQWKIMTVPNNDK